MKILLAIMFSFTPALTQACLFERGYEEFKPNQALFEPKWEEGRIAPIPVPNVGTIHVTRGSSAPGSLCEDAGTLSLSVSLPKASAYKLKELGFYFRVLGGAQPDQIFPLEPISGNLVGERAQFFFAWLDGHPSGQRPLNLDVEVFAVNKGLQIGPSQKFRVSDAVR